MEELLEVFPEVILVFAPILVIGSLLGGIIGAILAKWPARTALGNALRGALLSTGTIVIFVVFAFLVVGVSLDWFGADPGRLRS